MKGSRLNIDQLRQRYEVARADYLAALRTQLNSLVLDCWPRASTLRISVRPDWENHPALGGPHSLEWVEVHEVRDATNRVLCSATDPDDATGGSAQMERAAALLNEIVRADGPIYWPQHPLTPMPAPPVHSYQLIPTKVSPPDSHHPTRLEKEPK